MFDRVLNTPLSNKTKRNSLVPTFLSVFKIPQKLLLRPLKYHFLISHQILNKFKQIN